jgi:hypothetical protein
MEDVFKFFQGSYSQDHETLRYFYSAMFQGFAAIITLGSMFYLYFSQNINNTIRNIEERLYNHCIRHWNDPDAIETRGLREFSKFQLDEHVESINISTTNLKKLYEELEGLDERKIKVKNRLPNILYLSMVILIVSMVSLFFVNNNILSTLILFWIGVGLIIFSVFYLFKVVKFILLILDIN